MNFFISLIYLIALYWISCYLITSVVSCVPVKWIALSIIPGGTTTGWVTSISLDGGPWGAHRSSSPDSNYSCSWIWALDNLLQDIVENDIIKNVNKICFMVKKIKILLIILIYE